MLLILLLHVYVRVVFPCIFLVYGHACTWMHMRVWGPGLRSVSSPITFQLPYWESRQSLLLNLKLAVLTSLASQRTLRFPISTSHELGLHCQAATSIKLFSFFFLSLFWHRGSLCRPGYPGAHCVDYAGFNFIDVHLLLLPLAHWLLCGFWGFWPWC